MKNLLKVSGFIMLIGLFITACDHGNGPGGGGGGGGDENGTGIKAPDVGELPEFPPGSNPATTRADAEAVLRELRQSPILDSIRDEIWEVYYEQPEIDDYDYDYHYSNFSFSNRSLPNGYVKVSANRTQNETNTGGFKTRADIDKTIYEIYNTIYELEENYPIDWDEIENLEEELDRLIDERDNIQFAVGDRYNWTSDENIKGEVTRAKKEDGVTISQGSIFELPYGYYHNEAISRAGTYTTARFYTSSEKYQDIRAFTVTTANGSIKIILDMTTEAIETGNYEDNTYTYTVTETYSGSLKVYGNNNALLIDYPVKDWESWEMAEYMLSYDPYPFEPESATPLTSNVKVNGSTTALYSIDVTSGTKYHIWWDVNLGGYMMDDVRVRGYYSNGTVFFDMFGNWSLGWSNNKYYSFTATASGMVYIMVYPEREGDNGYFEIVYNTTGVQPSMSVLNIEPSGTTFSRLENRQESPTKPRKLLDFLRNNKKGFLNR